ncbi:hypothetical protein KKI24_28640 [bacterium]|nr:hypothetical protein [bacterium]
MRKYITNKCITLTEISTNQIKVEDALGNYFSTSISSNIFEYCKSKKLDIVGVEQNLKTGFINPKFPFSILIDDVYQSYLEDKLSTLFLILRDIEDFSFQLISGKLINQQYLDLFMRANELELQIREGHIDSAKYEQYINGLMRWDSKIAKALSIKNKIVRIGDVIRSEFFHAEYCIFNLLDSLNSLIINEEGKAKFLAGEERICYGFYPDASVWSLVDSIKSVSTALDALSKLVKLVTDANYDTPPKTKNVLFGSLKQPINWKGSFFSQSEREQVEKYIQELQILINFRHEVTHNIGLYNSSNSVFVGYETECVEKLKLLYSDMLIWDYEDEAFLSAQKYTGFFSQQNNAVSFVKHGLAKAILLAIKLFKLMRFDLLAKCKSHNMNELVTVQYNLDKSITHSKQSVSELEKVSVSTW